MVADVVATIELLPGRRLPIMLLLGFEQLAGVLQRLLGGNPTRPGGRLPAGHGFLRRGFARGAGGARWLRHRPGRPGGALRGRLLLRRLPCGRFLRSRLLRGWFPRGRPPGRGFARHLFLRGLANSLLRDLLRGLSGSLLRSLPVGLLRSRLSRLSLARRLSGGGLLHGRLLLLCDLDRKSVV